MGFKTLKTGIAHLIVKRYVGPFWARRKWLNKTQWFNEEELQKIQLNLLRRLIHHCYSSVPYYRQLMDERGIGVNDIMTVDDLKKFPILTKNDVLQAGTSIISTKYPKWTLGKARTGGSTGTPMIIYRNLFSIGNEHAFVRRQWDWAGISLRDKCAYLSGRVVAPPKKKGARLYAYDPMMRELILSTYHLSTNTAKDYAKLMKEYEVKAIVGYPSAIHQLAKTCLDSGFKIRLRATLTTCEALNDSMRDTISEAFGCRVYDFYGAAERVCYIHTCEHSSYHIIPEYGLTELVPIDEYGKGYYKVVSTGFWNKAMPLIRYDTGDIVYKSGDSCTCGRHFPVIKSIIGREGDVIETPSGKRLGVTIVVHLMYVVCGINNILETQFVQDATNHITIEYVPGDKFSEDDLVNIRARLAEYLPSDLKFSLNVVDAVRRTQSGKIKPIISLIKS